MEMQFSFDSDFQLQILELMIRDADFGRKCSTYIQKQYFANKYLAYFFDVIKDTYKEYDYCSWTILENEVFKFPKDKIEPYKVVLDKIKSGDRSRDFQYVRNQLEPFIKKALTYQINEKLVKNQNRDPDKVMALVEKDLEKIKYLSLKENQYMTLKESFKIMEDSAEDCAQLLPLGIPEIDTALGGGIARGVMTLAIGGTNVGKSIFLVNAAYNFMKQGYKVLYLNLEGEKNEVMLRILSRATGIAYGKIMNNNLNDEEVERINKVNEKYGDNLMVKHAGDFRYSVEDCFAMCREVYQEFEFDVFVCDYGQILSTREKFGNIRERMMYVHRGLASIGNVHNAAVITVAQGTRDAQQKNNSGDQLLRMTDVSECFEIVRAAAIVLTLNRSEEDEASERIRVLLEKQRKGRKGILVHCKTDMSFIGFYGDEDEGLGFMEKEELGTHDLDDLSTIPMAR